MWVDLAQVRPSRLRQAVRLAWFGLVALLVMGAGLTILFKILALLGLGSVALCQFVWQSRQPQLLLLQQLDRSRWQWQQSAMQFQNTRQSQKSIVQSRRARPVLAQRQIQARLLHVDEWLGLVVILRFEVTALGQSQTWLIWRDQVDADNWRRLQVLQQYWAAPDPS